MIVKLRNGNGKIVVAGSPTWIKESFSITTSNAIIGMVMIKTIKIIAAIVPRKICVMSRKHFMFASINHL